MRESHTTRHDNEDKSISGGATQRSSLIPGQNLLTGLLHEVSLQGYPPITVNLPETPLSMAMDSTHATIGTEKHGRLRTRDVKTTRSTQEDQRARGQIIKILPSQMSTGLKRHDKTITSLVFYGIPESADKQVSVSGAFSLALFLLFVLFNSNVLVFVYLTI